MENEQIYNGKWWLPENPDRKVSGRLTVSKEYGLHFELDEPFDGPNLAAFYRFPIILGVDVANRKLITLENCMLLISTFNPPVSEKSGEYYNFYNWRGSVTNAYIGVLLPTTDQLVFSKADINLSSLQDWLGISPDIQIVRSSRKNKKPYFYKALFNYPEIAIKFNSGKISVVPGLKNLSEYHAFGANAMLRLELTENINLETLLKTYIRPLQDFLSLATGKPNEIVELSLYSKFNPLNDLTHPSLQVPTISVLTGNNLIRQGVPTQQNSARYDELFNASDISGSIGSVLSNWLEFYNKYENICNLYFNVVYSPDLYLENKFLNLAQALESFHRLRFGNQLNPECGAPSDIPTEEEYQAFVKKVLKECPKNEKDWWRNKLQFINEPSLRWRLKSLIKDSEQVMKPLLGDLQSKDFVDKVVNTRNYLTHYSQESYYKSAKGYELEVYTSILQILMQSCFLKEIGISPQIISYLFEKTGKYARTQEQVGRLVELNKKLPPTYKAQTKAAP